MHNRLRRGRIPLIVIVVASSAILRLLLSRSFDAPWIAPDEMVYGMVGREFWSTGRITLLGSEAPFYGVYPILVGAPLRFFGPETGVQVIQAVQALVMSLTAVVVWAWTRPLAGNAWALTGALLTATLPALAYSGLLMTEAAFLPAGTLALWLMARALARPTQGRQVLLIGGIVLATATRLQGMILIPILLTAAPIAAAFGRDIRLLSRLAPTWIAVASLGILWLGTQLALHGTLANGLGAYGVAATSGYDVQSIARWALRHAGDVFLLVVGVPLVAAGILAYESARGRVADAGVRGLAAVTVSALVWLTLQVGTFASRYVGQLAERDMIVVAPLLFACLVTWLARGLPRPQPAASILALAVAVPAVLLPVRELVTPAAVPDAFMTIPLARLSDAASLSVVSTAWTFGAAGLVALAVVVPRRAAPLVPALIGAVLVASSILTASELTHRTQSDRQAVFGTANETWIDDVATTDVTYLYDGNAYWNAVSKTAFWNDRIRRVVRLPGADLGPIPAAVVTPRADGTLVGLDGRPIGGSEIVASTAFTFDGEPVAEVAQTNLDQQGLRLWRTTSPPRLSQWTTGLTPNGDIVRPVRVTVFGCTKGRLVLTLLGKQGTPVEIDVDGRPRLRLAIPAGTVWNGSVDAPASARGAGRCTFDLRSAGLVGSTQIGFVPA